MKRKASVFLILLAMQLLLSGCIPLSLGEIVSLEEFFSWTERFTLNIPQETMNTLLGPVVNLILALILALGFYGLISVMISGANNEKIGLLDILQGKYGDSCALILATVILLSFVPMSNLLITEIFPDNLNLDWVLDTMRWEVTINPVKIVTTGWGALLTLWLPIISSAWQIIIVFASVVFIIYSVAVKSGRALKAVFLMALGWSLFPFLYYGAVSLIGELYPDGWGLIRIDSLMSVIYIFITVLLLNLCYLGSFVLGFVSMRKSRYEDSFFTRSWNRVFNDVDGVAYQNTGRSTVNRYGGYRHRGEPYVGYDSRLDSTEPNKKPGSGNVTSRLNKVESYIKKDTREKHTIEAEAKVKHPDDKKKTTAQKIDRATNIAAIVGIAAGHPEVTAAAETVSTATRIVDELAKNDKELRVHKKEKSKRLDATVTESSSQYGQQPAETEITPKDVDTVDDNEINTSSYSNPSVLMSYKGSVIKTAEVIRKLDDTELTERKDFSESG